MYCAPCWSELVAAGVRDAASKPAPPPTRDPFASAREALDVLHDHQSSEVRARAAAALAALDPKTPRPGWRGPLEGAARAIADLFLACAYSGEEGTRIRAAAVLRDVCAEAAAIATTRTGAAA